MTLSRRLLARSTLLYRLEMWRRTTTSRITRRGVIRRYLARADVPCLQLGTGQHVLDGWLNTDVRVYRRGRIVYMDARRPFPLPTAAFAFAFSEHQIEHIPEADAGRMLRECHRVLRPGGRIRIATPDLAWVASLAVPPLSAERVRYVDWMSAQLGLGAPDPAAVVNALFRGIEAVAGAGHHYLYSFDALRDALERAGFRQVVRRSYRESDEAALRDVDGHGEVVGDEIARLETLVVEATRP